jgi:hypothetical protein
VLAPEWVDQSLQHGYFIGETAFGAKPEGQPFLNKVRLLCMCLYHDHDYQSLLLLQVFHISAAFKQHWAGSSQTKIGDTARLLIEKYADHSRYSLTPILLLSDIIIVTLSPLLLDTISVTLQHHDHHNNRSLRYAGATLWAVGMHRNHPADITLVTLQYQCNNAVVKLQ